MSWKGGAGAQQPWAGQKAVVKPAIAPAGKPAAAAASNGKTPVLTVSSNSKKDEIGVQTLVGDYSEIGTNHGRKYFQKIQEIPGHKDVKVFLYYWDQRDGADFAGWWFGDEVGGSQVWARCSSHGTSPPAAGWKIPWDAMKAEPGLLTVGPYKAGAGALAAGGKGAAPAAGGKGGAIQPGKGAVAAGGQAAGAVSPAALQARVQKATQQVTAVETSAKAAAAKAKAMTKDSGDAPLKKMQEILTAEQTKLAEAQKTLTQDINDARKGGPAAVSSVTELSKLSPRLRTVSAAISTELNKIKGFTTMMAKQAEIEKKNAASAEQVAKMETKNSKELEETLPVVQEAVSAAEDAVEAVGIMAAPIVEDPPEDAGDSLKKVIEEIETAASDAQNRLTETRSQINAKVQAARQFAPEARKVALEEFTTLQTKLAEAQKKLNPFKNFKREFTQRVEAKKAVADLTEKLTVAELEVEKASMMSTGSGSQMSEEDIKAGEELVTPAKAALMTVSKLLEAKLRGAQGPLKEELTTMKKSLADSQAKVDEVSNSLKSQREGLTLQSAYTKAQELADKAEESMSKCSEAELSFLKGIEVLPQDESEKAIKDSEAAAAGSSAAVTAAMNFIRQTLQKVKTYSKETAKRATDELTELQKKVEAVQKRLNAFKQETSERKVNALMAEAIDVVVACEDKKGPLTEAGKIFASDDLETTSVEALKEAGQKVAEADKELTAKMMEARKIIAAKQKVSRDKAMMDALSKLTSRINAVQQEQTKVKKEASTGDRLVKGKEVCVEAEAKMNEVEAEVEKAQKLSKPEDEGLGVETMTDESVLEMEATATSASKSVKVVQSLVNSHLPQAAAAVKATLIKLQERSKAAHTALEKVRADTKNDRERVLSESYAKECTKLTDSVEAEIEKFAAAEEPYLKGVEVLAAEESAKALAAADEAITAVQDGINKARTLIAGKSIEMKKFDAKNRESSIEALGKQTERINSAAQKLGQFKKDTDSRKKKAQLVEAEKKVDTVQAEVAKVAEAMKPMLEKDADSLSSEEAASIVKNLEDLEAEAKKQVNDCRNVLAARTRDVRGDAEKTKLVQELSNKLSGVQADLNKTMKESGNQCDKIRAKALLQETADKLKEAEAEVEKATAACAPLIEKKCEQFLVKTSLATMCAALAGHMEEKGLDEAAMVSQMDTQDKFTSFVEKMPEALGREECSFKEERRLLMFKTADADGDGKLSVEDFKSMFQRDYACVSGISVTDVFDIGAKDLKTVCKLEPGDAVISLAAPKATAKEGEEGRVERLKCKVVAKDVEGYVTMQGNSGTKYLALKNPLDAFMVKLDKELQGFQKDFTKVVQFFTIKTKELMAIAKDSPLLPARDELQKAKQKIGKMQADLDGLKRRSQQVRKEYPAMELKEKNAHIEAKEQKEADAITGVVTPLMEKLDAELKKLEEAAKPLTERSGTDLLQSFATPLSVQKESAAIESAVKEAAEAAKTSLKEQQALVAKAVKGPMLEAKKELQKMFGKASGAASNAAKVTRVVKTCCDKIAEQKLEAVSAKMREEQMSSGTSVEDSFSKLAAGSDRISEEAFAKHVQGLSGLEIPAEHATLIVQRLGSGGISRRPFMRLLQQYFKVVKDIAITPVFDVINSKEKPVRKAEVDEIMEVTEGPKKDEDSGLHRVKVKALTDGAAGWVSVKGNQGKMFLEETQKPFFCCLKDQPLEKEFMSGSDVVRTAKAEEVVELVEGPRVEAVGNVQRLRGKAVSDGKVGWITSKDKHGAVLADKEGKVYTCTATVAITDNFDIKNCKVLKKLSLDDVFTVTEGPIKEEDSGISRVKVKVAKEDLEGWVTIQGNAGTVYAKVNEKLYTIKKEVALQSKFQSDSETVRMLAADEAVELQEGPKEEKVLPAKRVQVRTSDGSIGWLTVKPDSMKAWTPFYKFIKACSLYMAKGLKESVVREVTQGETLELQDGPVDVEGDMWVCGKMLKDGVVGWVTMKSDEGAKLLIQGR